MKSKNHVVFKDEMFLSGSSITLRCGLSNADNGWVYCGWTHELVNVYVSNV